MEFSAEELRKLAYSAVDGALAGYNSTSTTPILQRTTGAELAAALDGPVPLQGVAGEQVLQEFFTQIMPHCRNNAHPLMAGYVVSAGTWLGALGDFLASVINQNVTAWRSSPAAATLEHVVVRWLGQILGFSENAAGILLSGGSLANFSALAAALRAKAGAEINTLGVAALAQPPVFYCSALTHLSIAKGLSLLGVGSNALRNVAHDAQGRLSLAALEAAVTEDKRAGRLPICVIANAGDVNTGAFDDLTALGQFCQRAGLWLHVDAAYGGFAALAPSAKPLFAGMQLADSVSVDAHKWLSVPIDAGCLLVRDATALRAAFSHDADYIQVLNQAPLESFAFWDYGPELSRRFRALKIWFTLKSYGTQAIGAAIEGNLQAVRELAEAVENSADFELLAPVGLSIICFRYVPTALRADLAAADSAQRSVFEAQLDALNLQLLQRIQKNGRAYLSNASIAGKFALRACVVNHHTGPQQLLPLLDILRETAQE